MTNDILSFNEVSLHNEIRKLGSESRALCALLAAFRLLPYYRRFQELSGLGDIAELERHAARLLEDCSGAKMTSHERETAAETIRSLIPSEDQGWHGESQAGAEDAASALYYAYRARITEKSENVVWALRCAYDAMDYQEQLGFEMQPHDRGFESSLLTKPLIQKELAQQYQDLEDLARWQRLGRAQNDLEEILRRRGIAPSVDASRTPQSGSR